MLSLTRTKDLVKVGAMNKKLLIGGIVLGVMVVGLVTYRLRPRNGDKELVEKVGKLVALPSGEEPTVATVTEREKLAGQPFFASAENGDKVLIYTKARKAILYDPDTNRVLEIAPLNIDEPLALPSASPSAEVKTYTYKFVVRNGAGVAGVAGKFAETIKQKLPGSEIVETGNAQKSDYAKSLLVKLGSADIDEVAKILAVEVGELPPGEASVSADFLVLVGKDFE